MPPQLDPIMGVPIIGTSDELDQIPMDSQVFPYDDLKATDKPGRGPAYPDDILPTSAVLVGQNQNNPQQVQTLYTDGNHNLRVAVESGGGGSGGLSPFVTTNRQIVQNLALRAGVVDVAPPSSVAGTYLLGCSFAVSVDGAGLSGPQWEVAELVLRLGLTRVSLAALHFWFGTGGAAPTPPYASIFTWLPVPINLAESVAGYPSTGTYQVNSGGWAIACDTHIITGNPQT